VTRPRDEAAELELLIEQVRSLADRTGSATYRQAARLLAGERRGGRPPTDDTDALEAVRRLIAEGRGPWSACLIVARKVGTNINSARSVAKRLLRKMSAKEVS
jgi:hypothetical protein